MTDETAGTAGQDPYALARVIAMWRRRAGLTRRELADRAGMSLEQLNYLEDRPISVQQATVARLAAALGVPVRTLIASSRHQVPGSGAAAAEHRLVDVSPEAARELLASGTVGRVALTTASGPAILPVNYIVVEGVVALRTAPGSPVAGLRGTVAFEVDHLDDERELGWSVLVVGEAAAVTDRAQGLRLEQAAYLRPWAGGDRGAWVRIVPSRVTGRRILPADPSGPGGPGEGRNWAPDGAPPGGPQGS